MYLVASFDFITTRRKSTWWSCPFHINGLGVIMLCCMVFRAVAWGKIQGGGGSWGDDRCIRQFCDKMSHFTICTENSRGGGKQLPPRRLRPWSWENLRDISHKAMLQSQALRENKIIIQHIAKSYNASLYFILLELSFSMIYLMQIIFAFSDKKLRSSVRLICWFTRPAANNINVRMCVSICTNIFIELTKCLWDKFELFLELVVQSVVCKQTVE